MYSIVERVWIRFQIWNLRFDALVLKINTSQLGSRGLWALIKYVLIECMKVFVWMLDLDWGFIWIQVLTTELKC